MLSEPLTAWRTEFDPILNQVYYIDEQGLVSFDSPCEVQNGSKRKSSGGFLSRISSKLSLIRSKSSTHSSSSCPVFAGHATHSGPETHSDPETSSGASTKSLSSGITNPPYDIPTFSVAAEPEPEVDSDSFDTYSASFPSPLSVSDPYNGSSYLMEQAFDIHEYDDMSSVATEESIQSFYHDLPRSEIYYDHESAVYIDKFALPHFDFDMDQERYELRQQMLKELY
ncbi:hypothetical protein JCM33374_g407 [Metschnikowia sp. JCM 33374]|nr:hypothetical protein JCM33374_g407 [Metschnikowia sp. JCM 33374]